MERKEKIEVLQALQDGSVRLQDLLTKVTYFILPANNGTENVIVVTAYGTKEYTLEQFRKTKFYQGWNGNAK